MKRLFLIIPFIACNLYSYALQGNEPIDSILKHIEEGKYIYTYQNIEKEILTRALCDANFLSDPDHLYNLSIPQLIQIISNLKNDSCYLKNNPFFLKTIRQWQSQTPISVVYDFLTQLAGQYSDFGYYYNAINVYKNCLFLINYINPDIDKLIFLKSNIGITYVQLGDIKAAKFQIKTINKYIHKMDTTTLEASSFYLSKALLEFRLSLP